MRNLEGPHAGLPRINERNVALAAQNAMVQDTTSTNSSRNGRSSGRYHIDGDDGSDSDSDRFNPRPTEHEELILRSVPGHSLEEVRDLLKQHGNLWETVVEVLIAQDAEAAAAGGGADVQADPSPRTRSRGSSQTYLKGSSARHSLPSSPPRKPLLPVPEHMRVIDTTQNAAWRGASPASSSGGDATSASTHATNTSTTTTNTSTTSAEDGTSAATTVDGRGSRSPEVLRGKGVTSGVKRAASIDPVAAEWGERSPKRRSSSREREREERSVDGALASDFDAATSTVQLEGDDVSGIDANTPGSSSVTGTLASTVSQSSSISTPLDTDSPGQVSSLPYSSTTYSYPLDSSRGRLSPPLSPRLLAREDMRNMSAKDKREIELKRKRDRQRERRAQARLSKESRTTKAKEGKGTAGKVSNASPATLGAAPGMKKMKRRDRLAEERREARSRESGAGSGNSSSRGGGSGGAAGAGAGTGSGHDMPKGFVELKI